MCNIVYASLVRVSVLAFWDVEWSLVFPFLMFHHMIAWMPVLSPSIPPPVTTQPSP